MIKSKKNSCCLMIFLLLSLSINLFASQEKYRGEFLNFITGLYKWASYANSKRDKDEPLNSVYYKIDKKKLEKFGSFFRKK